jgi:hypothetical protein
MTAAGERRSLVEKQPRPRNDPAAADAVVAAASRRAVIVGDRVGAVQRVIQAAPAGICGVQRVACIRHGNHELRSRDAGDLRIDVLGRNREILRLWLQIAYAAQKFGIGIDVERLGRIGPVPCINLALQVVTPFQQCCVARRQIGDHTGEALPEHIGSDAGAWQGFVIDEGVKRSGNLQAAGIDQVHPSQLLKGLTSKARRSGPRARLLPAFLSFLR